MLGPWFWELCWVSDGQSPGMKTKDLFLGSPSPLDMPCPVCALLDVPSHGSWCPALVLMSLQRGFEDPWAGRSQASKEGNCAYLYCDADGPWGLRPGQWLGFQQQEQPVQISRGFSLWGWSPACREGSWHCPCPDRCSAPRWDELACLGSVPKGVLSFLL